MDENMYRDRKELWDLNLLQTQSNAQIILAIGYLLEYSASNQAIEVIKLKRSIRQQNEMKNGYTEDEEQEIEDEAEQGWKRMGLDADRTALLAAELELYGQTILTRLDYLKLQFIDDDVNRRDALISKSANYEIYTGAMLEEIAYMFNLEGARKLFAISNENPAEDDWNKKNPKIIIWDFFIYIQKNSYKYTKNWI